MSLFLSRVLVFFSCLVLCRVSAQLEIEVVPDIEPSANPPEDVSPPEAADHSPDRGRQHDSLTFLNGNTLTGSLERMDTDGMVWRHPDAAAPIRFNTRNLKKVDLKLDGTDSEALADLPLIECTNGDRFRGQITGLRAGKLQVSSPAAGALTLQADTVSRLVPGTLSSVVYEGPVSEKEWEMHNLSGGDDTWVYRDRALYAKGQNLAAVYTPEDPPDLLTVSMKLEWKGMLNFQLGYWGENSKNPNQDISGISLQNNYFRAYRHYKSVGRHNMMSQQIQQELNDGEVILKLHLDRSGKQAVFFLDNTMIAQWRDSFDGDISGNQVMLYTQGNSSVRVSEIVIREWDGEIQTEEEVGEGAHDWLATTTGDEFVGKVLRIDDGMVFFENEYAKFEVPMERVGEITFNPESRKTPVTEDHHAKVLTTSGDVTTLTIDRMENRVLYGASDIAGDVALNLEYFSGLLLNPLDERQEETEWSW